MGVITMILPATRNTVCSIADLPNIAGEIPTAQVKLEDVQVANFASWMDDHLNDLEFRFQDYWTRSSQLDALFQGTRRR
jgi:hypothetical protein